MGRFLLTGNRRAADEESRDGLEPAQRAVTGLLDLERRVDVYPAHWSTGYGQLITLTRYFAYGSVALQTAM